MESTSAWCPTRLNSGAIIVLICINDLSQNVSDRSIPILFADGTSFILTSYDASELSHKANEVFNIINKWFHSNSLMLNYNKTYILQFQTKTNNQNNTKISYINKSIAIVKSMKFLALTVDTTLNWKNHISDIKIRLLCHQVYQTFHVIDCTEKYILLVRTFYYVLWTHILGKFY